MPLWVALSEFKTLSCSDPRDKVYGVHVLTRLGEVGLESEIWLNQAVDYGQPTAKVIRDATRAAIWESANLNVLQCLEEPPPDVAGSDCENGPSWVPRWDKELDQYLPTRFWTPAGAVVATVEVDRELVSHHRYADCLSLKGYRVDYITEVGPKAVCQAMDDEITYVRVSPGDVDRLVIESMRMLLQLGKPHLLSQVMTAMTSGQLASEEGHLSDPDIVKYTTDLFEDVSIGVRRNFTGREGDHQFNNALNNFYSVAGHYCMNRCVFHTECGRVGIGPTSLIRGDCMAVLFGGWPLFALRSFTHSTTSERGELIKREIRSTPIDPGGNTYDPQPPYSTNDQYRIVGKCYIHELMDSRLGAGTDPSIFQIW